MRRGLAPADAGRRGSALVVLVVATLPLILASGTMLMVVANRGIEVQQQAAREVARTISVSAAHDALARLEVDPTFGGRNEHVADGGTAMVEVVDWATDGMDNDGNGWADDPAEEDLVQVRSVGWLNGNVDFTGKPSESRVRSFRSTADILLRRLEVNLELEQSLYVDDPLALFTFNGNAFLLSGNDTNPDGSKGSEAPRPAIGTPGDPKFILDQLAAQQADNVVGEGGFPSVLKVTEQSLATTMKTLTPLAKKRWTGPAANFTGALGDWDSREAVVAHAEGDLHLHGTTTGFGVLLVEGDLEVKGTFDYVGIVLVGGSLVFRGGGGTKNLHGAALCLGSVEGDADLVEDVEISGNIELMFSSLGISEAVSKLGGFEVVTWLQE